MDAAQTPRGSQATAGLPRHNPSCRALQRRTPSFETTFTGVPKLKQVHHPNSKSRGPIWPRLFCLEIKIPGLQYICVPVPSGPVLDSQREGAANQNLLLCSPRKRSESANQLAAQAALRVPIKGRIPGKRHTALSV